MESTLIRIPVDVKLKLEERASGRPIYRMLSEDFLHEPDMQKLMELRFDHLNKRLDSLEEKVEAMRQVELSRSKIQLQMFADLQEGIKQGFQNIIDRTNSATLALESRISQDEDTIKDMTPLIQIVADLVKHTGVYDGK